MGTEKIKTMKNIVMTLVLILSTVLVGMAQFVGPPSFAPDVLDNPIDGGLGLLLGAGAAYGAKRLKDRRKRKEQDED